MLKLAALKAQPDLPVRIQDPARIRAMYGYWRARILLTSLLGYAIFYFVRLNISAAQKPMGAELHYDKSQTGLIMSIGGVIYGVSKFANGFLGDRANPRYFMAIGLFACAIVKCSSFSAVRKSISSLTRPPVTFRYGVSMKPNSFVRAYVDSELIRPMFGPSGVSIGQIRP